MLWHQIAIFACRVSHIGLSSSSAALPWATGVAFIDDLDIDALNPVIPACS